MYPHFFHWGNTIKSVFFNRKLYESFKVTLLFIVFRRLVLMAIPRNVQNFVFIIKIQEIKEYYWEFSKYRVVRTFLLFLAIFT